MALDTRKMHVVSYLSTLPKKTLSNSKKSLILSAFAQGVTAIGDNGIATLETNYIDSDVGVMLGWVHENGKKAPHLLFRKKLIDTYLNQKKHIVVIDSNMFLYINNTNPYHILRYGFDGVFPNTANYCDNTITSDRWEYLSKLLNISLKPTRTNGTHILICLQRDGGWSMNNYSVLEWAKSQIQTLNRYSSRPIRIRTHPGDKSSAKIVSLLNTWCLQNKIKNVSFSDSTKVSLTEDLHNCWAMVNHNSSPAVGAIIEGIPVFLTDPIRSQCKEVSNFDLSKIEQPIEFDRTSWVHRLSMFHWTEDEVRNGSCWRHMRNFI